jgi:hypothetical protein
LLDLKENQSLFQSVLGQIDEPVLFFVRHQQIFSVKTDKYLMKTYRALVCVHTRGRTNYVKTEVRAESAQDARWLLWAQYGFHSIYSGPELVNTRWAA